NADYDGTDHDDTGAGTGRDPVRLPDGEMFAVAGPGKQLNGFALNLLESSTSIHVASTGLLDGALADALRAAHARGSTVVQSQGSQVPGRCRLLVLNETTVISGATAWSVRGDGASGETLVLRSRSVAAMFLPLWSPNPKHAKE